MAGANLGPDHDLAKRLTLLEDQVQGLSTRDVLKNAQIGSGGLTVTGGSIHVTGGGSIVVDGGGSMTLPAGTLLVGGDFNAGGAITAGTSLNGTSLNVGSGGITGGTLTVTGGITGGGLFIGRGTATVGQVNASGGVAASGAVSGTTGTFNSGLYSTDARNFVVVNNYAASWIDVNGHLGISPSTERFKKDIAPWVEADPEKLFAVTPVKYHLRIPDRYMPIVDEANVPVIDPLTGVQEQRLIEGYEEAATDKLRTGFIAERLVELGFEENVVFDEQGLPVSINYAEWVVPLQMGIRYLRELVKQQQAQINDLSLRLKTAGIA
jgi:hypothetical protein